MRKTPFAWYKALSSSPNINDNVAVRRESGTFAGGARFNAIFYKLIITRSFCFVKYKITKNYKNIYIILRKDCSRPVYLSLLRHHSLSIGHFLPKWLQNKTQSGILLPALYDFFVILFPESLLRS